MKYNNWQIKIERKIARLVLNREQKLNNLNQEVFFELREISAWLAKQDDIWVVIVEGAGKHFSFGVDVEVIYGSLDESKENFQKILRENQLCLDAFEALEKPTIAKINGFCIGGGLILALCCDFRIAAANSVFILPEVKRGIAVLMGTQRVSKVIGLARTKELIMLGDKISANKAENFGLIHKAVAKQSLEGETNKLARKLLQLPPKTVSICKRIIDQGYDMNLRESQELEIEAQSQLLGSHDLREGLASFVEKRKPVFNGS